MATLILKNNTGSVVTITDVGIVIPASGQDSYTDPETIVSLAGSGSVRTLLTAATLTANNGTSDLILADALAYLEKLWSRGGRDEIIQIPDLGGELSDTQHGSRGAGTLHPAATTVTAGFMAPADKTKLDASGILTSATPAGIDVGDAATVGVATESARADHQHALPAPAAPANVTKAAASAGASATVARADHKHDVDTAAPVTIGTANSEGTATSLARSNHVHDHGAQALGTGNQHAVATVSVSGFMSPADKTKLDGLSTSNANFVCAFGIFQAAASYIEVTNNSFTSVSEFRFAGTGSLTPTVAKAILSASAADVIDARIQDITNNVTIALVTNLSVTALPVIYSLGALSNLPAGEAVFEIQLRKAATGKPRVHFVTMF